MRLAMIVSLFAFACGGGSSTPSPDLAHATGDLATAGSTDMSSAGPTLTVNNTLDWCTVTVTVGSASAVMFGGSSMSFSAASGTVIKLSAAPIATFMPVKWTGTASSTGDQTYTMTSAASQSVTACCAEPTGAGC